MSLFGGLVPEKALPQSVHLDEQTRRFFKKVNDGNLRMFNVNSRIYVFIPSFEMETSSLQSKCTCLVCEPILTYVYGIELY